MLFMKTITARQQIIQLWGGRGDSNPRPSAPQADALTRLSYDRHQGIF